MSATAITLKSCLYLSLSAVLLLWLTSFSAPTSPKRHTVEIRQMKFEPAALTVKKGDTVVFVNRDIVTHDVTEASGKSWKSPALPPGKSWSRVFTKSAGYFCSYHPVMKGNVEVK